MLWTVTSLWAAAGGGLLIYTGEHFDPWVATFGLALTVCAMFFAYASEFYAGKSIRRWLLNSENS